MIGRSMVLGAMALLGSSLAHAATYRVPEDRPTVLAALDAAVAGDSVLVGPGTWTTRATRTTVVFGGPSPVRANGFIRAGVTIIGTAGPEATVLEADTEAQTGVLLHVLVRADQPAPGTITIRGLTLRGRGQFHRPMTAAFCDLVMEDCILEDLGYGVRVDDCDVAIRRCIFRNNDGTGLAAEVVGLEQFEGAVTVEDCLFERNRGSMLFSMTLPVAASGTFRRNTIRGNWATVLTATEVYLLTFEDNLVIGNVPSSFGTLVSAYSSQGTISENTFAFNAAGSPLGIGIVETNFRTDIVGNTFYGNDPGSSRQVVFTRTSEPFHFRDNVIAGTLNGVGYWNWGPFRPTDGCNVFWDNPSGHFSGYTPQPTDRIADPLFCEADAGVFTVREGSPCLPGGVPGCGQIGAWGEGCGIVSVQPTSWGRIKNLYREGDAR